MIMIDDDEAYVPMLKTTLLCFKCNYKRESYNRKFVKQCAARNVVP